MYKQYFFKTSDGSKIHYLTAGSGEPLVLLHGNAGSIAYFKNQIPYFAKHFFVIAIDSRGQGKSTNASDRLTFSMMAEDIYALLVHEHLEHVNILGFSDGANLAMQLAVLHPAIIRKMVLNAGNIRTTGVHWWSQILSDLLYWLTAFLGLFSPKMRKKSLVFRLLIKDLAFSYHDLEKITTPTLVLVGAKDVILRSHSISLYQALPNATFLEMPRVGHRFAWQNPRAYNKIVLNFLEGDFV